MAVDVERVRRCVGASDCLRNTAKQKCVRNRSRRTISIDGIGEIDGIDGIAGIGAGS